MVFRTKGHLGREVDIHLVETPVISPPHERSDLQGSKAEESPTRPATPQRIFPPHLPAHYGSHASMHPIVCLLYYDTPSNMVRNWGFWDSGHRPVVIRPSKRIHTFLNESISSVVRIPTYPFSGIAQKSIRSISAGARWPMRTPSTANHKVPCRSRGSPPLLQLLHRRVRLPSVFDQNHGVARPGPRNEE